MKIIQTNNFSRLTKTAANQSRAEEIFMHYVAPLLPPDQQEPRHNTINAPKVVQELEHIKRAKDEGRIEDFIFNVHHLMGLMGLQYVQLDLSEAETDLEKQRQQEAEVRRQKLPAQPSLWEQQRNELEKEETRQRKLRDERRLRRGERKELERREAARLNEVRLQRKADAEKRKAERERQKADESGQLSEDQPQEKMKRLEKGKLTKDERALQHRLVDEDYYLHGHNRKAKERIVSNRIPSKLDRSNKAVLTPQEELFRQACPFCIISEPNDMRNAAGEPWETSWWEALRRPKKP